MLGLHFLYSPRDRTWKKEQTGKEAIINLEGLCKWPTKCTILKGEKLNRNKISFETFEPVKTTEIIW